MTARSSGARGLAAATALVLWAGCGGHETTSSTVVPPVALALRGADVSALARIEQGGGVFRDSGRAGDALATLRSRGANLFRLRLFVSPNDSDVQVNDLAYTAAMAGRVKAAGAKLLLDIHYSDTWADPGHQTTPAASKAKLYDWLRENAAGERKAGETDEQFFYKTRKKALGPFKKDWWSLPEMVRGALGAALEEQFGFLLRTLKVQDTVDLVAKVVKAPAIRRAEPAAAMAAAPDDAEAGE